MSDRRARRFRFQIDGVEWIGVAFTCETALDEFLRGRGVALDVSPSPARTGENDLDVVGGIGTPAADARRRRSYALPSSVTAEAKAGVTNVTPPTSNSSSGTASLGPRTCAALGVGEIEERMGGARRARDPEKTPRRRGRPSKSAIISRAVKRLGLALDPTAPQVDRARLIQKTIAQSAPPYDVPSVHTVEIWLAEHPAVVGKSKNTIGKSAGLKPSE
jgi:hypothetical protein